MNMDEEMQWKGMERRVGSQLGVLRQSVTGELQGNALSCIEVKENDSDEEVSCPL